MAPPTRCRVKGCTVEMMQPVSPTLLDMQVSWWLIQPARWQQAYARLCR